jgi:BirA family biotin operon repressor/biotin-[acetyl-CoA-carboxylase] ligase
MLNKKKLQAILPVNGFGQVLHFHKRIGSTNDEAKKQARKGAPHGTLIVAEEQVQGRGRAGRHWSTPSGSAIAMSLILRPQDISPAQIGELTVLGALATVEALDRVGANAWIKWPNDVLISGGKVAGVLVESGWMEDDLLYAVMGIGINVYKESLKHTEMFDFPAACIEDEIGRKIDRLELIEMVLEALSDCYAQLGTGALIAAWERNLAYKGRMVTVQGEQMNSTGKLLGITAQGQLRLQLFTGEVLKIGIGGQQLRPVDRK